MKRVNLKNSKLRYFCLFSLLFFLVPVSVSAGYDPPHSPASGVQCGGCHGKSLIIDGGSPFWTNNTEDEAYNAMCSRCHIEPPSTGESEDGFCGNKAPLVQTHEPVENEPIRCTVCHHNHEQDQIYPGKYNPGEFFIATGTKDGDRSLQYVYDPDDNTKVIKTIIPYSALSATDVSSKWADLDTLAAKTGVGRGAMLVPDMTATSSRWPVYMICGIDTGEGTITVKGELTSAASLGIFYGQQIRAMMSINSEIKFVEFYDIKGNYSYTNDSATGICQVCHTVTSHWSPAADPDDDHFGDQNCTTYCHKHTSGFEHGGNGGGENCGDCHNSGSHIIHLDNSDPRGPAIFCDACHDLDNMPTFNNQDGSGGHLLAETDVCDTCHSSAGSYDGINDVDVGAKTNWDSGVYENDKVTLKANKEKWCATCHDESASVVSSVTAPNVIGDEDGTYTYGTGWGYYKTGHGLAAGETFPSKGDVETLSGRPIECDACHDYSAVHIDGAAQTFDDGDVFGLDPAIYRQGYRLKLIDGQEPYRMPRPSNIGNSSDQYRVCFQGGCHVSEPFTPFTDLTDMNTNLVTDGINRHAYHLNFNNQELVAADWSGANNSRMTCVVCHNVHGSTQLAMVRDGKLIDRELGTWIWYKNDAVTYIDVNTSNPPEPEDLPLSASDGTAWLAEKSVNLCATCHAWNIRTTDRTPFQDVAEAPLLEWVGTNGLISDGVAPDSAIGNSTFTFRVSYSDINNDSPSPIEVWVDLNDKDGYEVGEKYLMAETDTTDTNIFNGKNYTKSISIAKTGDGILNYRFYAHDGVLEATGLPTTDSTITVTNNSPVLTWTEESYFETDGVHPNIGGNGADYQFRVTYTDADGECPPDPNNGDIQVVVGGVSYNLDNDDAAACDTGRIYYTTIPLSSSSPPQDMTYKFTAIDGTDIAVGNPTLNSTLTVQAGANNPPQLDWVNESCMTDGVKPSLGLATGNFDFKVMYTDIEGTAPSSIEIWVDLNDNDTVDAGEKQTMSFDSGDGDYTNGEIYVYTWVLNEADAGDHKYTFFAKDTPGVDAVGEPTETSETRTVEVVSTAGANGVRLGLDTGPIWYNTIQAAIDAIDGGHTSLVYEGTYNEDVVFDGTNDRNTTLRSICGPNTTIIDGSGSGTTVTFSRHSSSQIDGFQVTGGSTGINVNGTQVTINNCQVHDNNGLNGGGIAVVQSGDMPILTLTNSEIYNNSSDRGGGVRIWRGSGHTISNSIIRNNTITGDSMADGGGGIHLFQVPDITISNTVIKDNVSTNTYGGGGLYVSQVPDTVGDGLTVNDSIISGNTTGGNGGGVFSDLSKIKFARSSITGNTADAMGGAFARPSAGNTASFENCILADNHAYQAGMAKLNGGTLDIVNSTIANNRATDHSGAIYNQLATITIRNSILWGNQAATVGHIAHFNGGSITITDSIIQNDDDGNFTDAPFFTASGTTVVSGFTSEDDPWFVGGGDYHIQSLSPAIDNGSATYAPALDIDGQSRPQGVADDIGADEYTP